MIYLDTSVVLAHLFSEARRPLDALWDQPLISSELLHYEVRVRLHARRAPAASIAVADELLQQVALVDLSPPVLERAREPMPVAVRTLDALHLATMDYLRRIGQEVSLASYDMRLVKGARALGFGIAVS